MEGIRPVHLQWYELTNPKVSAVLIFLVKYLPIIHITGKSSAHGYQVTCGVRWGVKQWPVFNLQALFDWLRGRYVNKMACLSYE